MRFDDVVDAVHKIAGLHKTNEDKMEMKVPSYAVQTGNHLKRVANVMCGYAIRSGDKEMRESE